MKTFTKPVMAGLAALFASPAAFAVPHGTLVFETPYAVVSPTDSIDIWVTFTLDSNSPDLKLTNGGELTDGTLDAADIPADWLSYGRSYLNTYYACSGTFTNVCSPDAYQFDFNLSGPYSLNFLDTYTLLAGASVTYKFGTFSPVGGAAPAGTYTFYDTGLTLNLVGTAQKTDINGDPVFYAAGEQLLDLYGNPVFDVNGDPVMATAGDPVIIEVQKDYTLGNTGAVGMPFVREVTAVPEPDTWAMLIAGLGLVGFAARRRMG